MLYLKVVLSVDFFRLTPNGPEFLDQSEIESEKYGAKLTYTLPELGIAGLIPTVWF